jgi:hypothetical protein
MPTLFFGLTLVLLLTQIVPIQSLRWSVLTQGPQLSGTPSGVAPISSHPCCWDPGLWALLALARSEEMRTCPSWMPGPDLQHCVAEADLGFTSVCGHSQWSFGHFIQHISPFRSSLACHVSPGLELQGSAL